MTRISVLMPVFNDASTLPEAIEAVLCQTFGDFELIVFSDGSDDDSLSIAQSYESRDPRVHVFHVGTHQGLAATQNDLIAAANADSDYLAFVDSRGFCDPERLARQAAFLDAHPECGGVGCACDALHGAGGAVRSRFSLPESITEISSFVLRCPPVLPGCLMLRHELLAEIGGFYPLYPGAENYDFCLRLLQHRSLANLPDALVTVRLDTDRQTKRLKRALHAMLRIQRRYVFSGPYFTLSRAFGLLGRHLLLLLPSRLVCLLFYKYLCVKI